MKHILIISGILLAFYVCVYIASYKYKATTINKNVNRYNFYFCIPNFLYVVYLWVYINTYGWGGLALIYVILANIVLICILSIISNTKILNWIYGILFFAFFAFVIYSFIISLTKNHSEIDGISVSIYLVFLLSFVITYTLNKLLKNKNIDFSLCAFGFNTMALFVLYYILIFLIIELFY
jgi:hypothetical protein